MLTAKAFQAEYAHFLGCIPFEDSNLDARAIHFMNTFPGIVSTALDNQESMFNLYESLRSEYEKYTLDRVERETSHQPV